MSNWKVRPEKVLDLSPIEGADKIEVATVKGWKCVVKKGEFKVGDYGMYFPVDSLLPADNPTYSFMAPRHFRVKTIKLRKQISQGLLMPLSLFNHYEWNKIPENKISEINFAKDLGVDKWDNAVPLGGKMEGLFPSFIPKTDQERIQNVPELLTLPHLFEVTEKLDGTSCTMFLKDGNFGVCSRNFQMKHDESSVYSIIAKNMEIEEKLRTFGDNIAIQGEIIGPKIQGNRYNRTQQELYVFDVFDINENHYLTPGARSSFITALDILQVPIVTLQRLPNLEDLLKCADGISHLYDGVMREGLVYKCVERTNKGIPSFKVISNEWLLKYE